MKIFIDTAAFLAVLNANDKYHPQAKKLWEEILSSEDSYLFCSNYVILETEALLQNRFGMEAVRILINDILPVTEIIWIDETIHKQGLSALLAANQRNLSLVDCTSFELMRQYGLDIAFTFDTHFNDQGFKTFQERDWDR
jgi:uncharacterized protein